MDSSTRGSPKSVPSRVMRVLFRQVVLGDFASASVEGVVLVVLDAAAAVAEVVVEALAV
jgi:hypothetical protein